MGETYAEQLARQMGEADCETYVDGNGETQQSDDGPDRIGDPPKPKPKVIQQPTQNEENITYELF